MRIAFVLALLAIACSDKKHAADPPAATPPAAADEPAAKPAPPPVVENTHEDAFAAGIKIFTTLAPIVKEHRDDCQPALAAVEKALAGLTAELHTLDAALADQELAMRFGRARVNDTTALGRAWAEAAGPAIHCGAVAERLDAIVHVKPVKP